MGAGRPCPPLNLSERLTKDGFEPLIVIKSRRETKALRKKLFGVHMFALDIYVGGII